MLRTILAVLFAVCYLIIGIPVLFAEWLIHLPDLRSKTHRKRAEKCPERHTGTLCGKP